MPLFLLLVGLAALGHLVRGTEGQSDVQATYTLRPGERLLIPAGLTLATSHDRVLHGPVTVRSEPEREDVYADLGADGIRSITWT